MPYHILSYHTGVCGKNTPPEKTYTWEEKLSECPIRGWRAMSAAGLQGKGLRKRNIFWQKPASYCRRKILCIDRGVQCCTLRPKVQDEGPVYGAYKTTSQTEISFCASLCCHGWPRQLLLMRTKLCV